MRESEIEKILLREVKAAGGKAYKWVSPGNAGVPDRIVIFPDKQPIFVELKTDSGRVTPLQDIQMMKLAQLGQKVTILRGVTGLIRFFQDNGYPDTAERIAKKLGGKR